MSRRSRVLNLEDERKAFRDCNADIKAADAQLRQLLMMNSSSKLQSQLDIEMPQYPVLLGRLNNSHGNRMRMLNEWVREMERDKDEITGMNQRLMGDTRGMDATYKERMQNDVHDLLRGVEDRRTLEREARAAFAEEFKWRDNNYYELRSRVEDFFENTGYSDIPQEMKNCMKNFANWDENARKDLNKAKEPRKETPLPVITFPRPAPKQNPNPPVQIAVQQQQQPPPPPPSPPPQSQPQPQNNRQGSEDRNGIIVNGQDLTGGCCAIL